MSTLANRNICQIRQRLKALWRTRQKRASRTQCWSTLLRLRTRLAQSTWTSKRGILSQTSAFASQASPASQPKRVRFASSHVDVDGAASSAEVTTTSDADSTLSQFCDEHELCVADIVADLPLALPPLPSWISKVGDKDVPWRLDYNVERTAATLMIGGVVINLMIARLDQDADHGDGAADQVPASHRPRAPQC